MKLAAILCLCLAQTAYAQSSPAQANDSKQPGRDGVITVRVIGDDGQPVPEAVVNLFGVASQRIWIPSATTDAEGNFKFTGLAPAPYYISARAPGYVADRNSASGSHRIGDQLTINLVRGGVITGRVTDAYGEPLVEAQVTPRKIRDLEGRSTRQSMEAYRLTRLTDDRGVYRLYGLEPGVYVVFISGGHDQESGGGVELRTLIYHPSSTREAASEITVRGGEEAPGVDIRIRPQRGYTISGAITGAAQSDDRIGVVVILANVIDGQIEGVAREAGQGEFAIQNVPDGEYEITALREGPGNNTAVSNSRRLTVRGADVSGIVLKLVTPGAITGRVVIESAGSKGAGRACANADQSSLEEIALSARRDEIAPQSQPHWIFSMRRANAFDQTAPNQKGDFTLKNLFPGRHRIVADLPNETWYVRAVTQPIAGAAKNPIDVSSNGVIIKPDEQSSEIEVTIAEGAASLNGRVVPEKEGSKLPLRLRVHLIPAEVSAADNVFRYAETTVRSDGVFGIKHIAPGKYLLLARQIAEKEATDDQARPLAWDTVERAKLRREAAAAKNEIELKVCERVKEHVLRW
jgi:hypothetical protein